MKTTVANESPADPFTASKLAINGGPKAVTAAAPASGLHGPQEIGEEEIAAVTKVLRSKNFFRFTMDRSESMVARFEDLFAEKSGARFVLAVNSGTSALICGLVGIGVSRGDEVLVPGYTYIASAAAVLALGAIPVIVEIDESMTMDPADIENKITARTKAIIPVHMRGKPCDMEAIMAVARKHGLKVLEDCAQANGGFYKGRSLGLWGNAGAFSLQHFKVITAGEGGALITNEPEVFDRGAIYHDSAYTFWMEKHCDEARRQQWKDKAFLGENYRQSELHGAVAFEQLKKRDRILDRTRAIKARLHAACATIPGATMETVHDTEGDCGISLAFYMANAEQAKRIAAVMKAEGVPCGTRFAKDIPDRHIFYHWNYIMEKRTPHLNGFPWCDEDAEHPVQYSRDMCPRTVDILSRAVTIGITQVMTDEYVDQLCQGIEKVAQASD